MSPACLNYTIANHTAAPTSGSITGTDSVLLCQGESKFMKAADWCGYGRVTYTADTGYSVVRNGAVVASGTNTQYPHGWADISDASGVEIGVPTRPYRLGQLHCAALDDLYVDLSAPRLRYTGGSC
ncbi:MAG: hypothetical protein DMG57_43000 [Acidobacteria bacterium]|nr:MAG: hypothetical protein DMG57_43000 [Acidobacteriota bacterium]